ncbi:MAG: DUF192 domain-containing protein [Acidobacteria bacterium]|nr:DUF192 domain-containing protein [Acidobacteriota bacterium]
MLSWLLVRGVFLLLLAVSLLPAQPVLSPGGIVNATGFQPAGSPGGAIAQGSIFSIFGTGLGPAAPGVQVSSFPLGLSLAGVSVSLYPQAGAALEALPLFVSDRQINAILPSSTPAGRVWVQVHSNGQDSGFEPIKVVRSSFGVFTVNSGGSGPAVVQNYVSPAEQPLNSRVAPAAPGQIAILWGTGLGPIPAADNAVPPAGNLNEPVEVTLGSVKIPTDYQGRSGCCSGVDQIQFRIPQAAPLGCAVPLSIKVQNGVYSNIATIAIASDGRPCADAWNLPGGARRWGQIALRRVVLERPNAHQVEDSAAAVFAQTATPVLRPPAGSCASLAPEAAGSLDAGPQLTLSGPQGIKQVSANPSKVYRLSSAGGSAFLGPGTYIVSGTGGADVGPFTATLTAPAPISWTNVSGDRSQGLTLSWSGGDAQPGFVEISEPNFVCTAAAAPGSFTVPPGVLANLPAQFTMSLGAVSETAFTAPGLDAATLSYTHSVARTVDLGEPPLAASPVFLPDGQRILAELAVTVPEQDRGLMLRTGLDPDRGMLFLFDHPDVLLFWMYQTLIPLDIIWMDQDHRIVFISANTPPCTSRDSRICPNYGPTTLTQYVLEIGSGQAARYGLRVGDRLDW